MKLKLLPALLFLVLFSLSCNKNEDVAPINQSVLTFTSTIAGEEESLAKVAGTSWSNGDLIGIYMKGYTQNLSLANIVSGVENYRYKTSGDGVFQSFSEAEKIFLPDNGNKVDIVAYYPHKTTISSFIYPIDLSNQANQSDLDLLYSNNISGIDKSNATAALSFTRQLSKLVFNISASNGSNVNGLTVKITGLNTKADFSLVESKIVNVNSKADIFLKTTASGNNVIAEAIVLPAAISDSKIVITLSNGDVYKYSLPVNTTFVKGNKHTYNIVLNQGIQPVFGYVETPVTPSIQNTVAINHKLASNSSKRNYSMLYDTKYKFAYWVAYPLHKSYVGSGRTDAWNYDPDVNSSLQPNLSSGFPTTVYDRGHQIPSGDRNGNTQDNKATFYYTNMTAQHKDLNQKAWANLENQIRSWMGNDTVYVVTGAMITTASDKTITYTKDNSNKDIAVPKYYYKAIAKRKGTGYITLAFKMDNKPTSDSYNNYSLTVADLETLTGYTFFPSISANDKKNKNWE